MIKEVKAKGILGGGKDPDPWFGCKYNMNLYRGCQHQCIYCDSRSECYGIEDFDSVEVKINALELLRDELPRKRIKGTIGFGAMSDPYTYVERRYELTRGALKIIAKANFPVHIITKSNMVERDIDLLKKINQEYAAITFTLTTVDDDLAKKVEPRAPLPSQRLSAMRKLADAGIYTGITMMPILPFIEDTPENIVSIIKRAKEAGAQYIIPALGMTLRDRQRDYYYQKLDDNFPGLKEKYQQSYGNQYSCGSVNHSRLQIILRQACARFQLPKGIKVYQPRPASKFGQKSFI